MRNLPWEQATQLAMRRINFRNYFYYGDVWLPKDLKQGDIVRADLLTDFEQNGEPQVCPRNCIVLGMDLDEETMELSSIRLMPFSYFINDADQDREIILDPKDPEFRTKMSGFRDQVVLRTGRIDVVPPDSAIFGFYMDRIGRIDPELFETIDDAIVKGENSSRGHAKHIKHDDYMVLKPGFHRAENTIFVPGLDARTWADAYDFDLAENLDERYAGIDYFTLDEEAANAIADEMLEAEFLKVAGRRAQVETEAGLRHAQYKARHQADEEIREMLRQFKTQDRARRRELLEKALEAHDAEDLKLENAMKDAIAEGKAAGEDEVTAISTRVKIDDIPTIEELLAAQIHEESTHEKARAEALSRIFDQEVRQGALKDLEDFGIRGFNINTGESNINLPSQLWRGRYLMMRIPNLGNEEEMSEFSYRPCMVWNAYARVNEHGETELAGLELFPCTRDSARMFEHKMQVRPLDTKVKKPSFLIADMMIRAPLSSMYFQPDQPEADGPSGAPMNTLFHHLFPRKIDEFEAKLKIRQERRGDPAVYGLKEVPEDWIQIDLPDAPDEKMRKRLHKVRFMGSESNKGPTQLGDKTHRIRQREHRGLEGRARDRVDRGFSRGKRSMRSIP